MNSLSLEKNRLRSIDLTPLAINVTTAFTIVNCLELRVVVRIFGPGMTAVTENILHPFKYPDVFQMGEKFIHQLSAMFTCRDGKAGVLSSQATRILYSPRSAVNI